jgi:dihydroorotate dehydrogenase electron transfer subunit
MLESRLREGVPVAAHDPRTQVYACGPMPMLRRVAAICEKANVPAQVAVETMMGCGFGICMGCPVEPASGVAHFGRYLLACMDGPVFRAEDIRHA